MKKIFLYLLLFCFGFLAGASDDWDGPVRLDKGEYTFDLYLNLLIGQSNLSVIMESARENFPERKLPEARKVSEALDLLCGADFRWKIIDGNVVLIQPVKKEKTPLEQYNLTSFLGNFSPDVKGFDKYREKLWAYRLAIIFPTEIKLNYDAMRHPQSDFMTFLVELVKDRNALVAIKRQSIGQSEAIYEGFRNSPDYKDMKIHDAPLRFWTILFFGNVPERREEEPPPIIGKGDHLLEAKLSLGKKFEFVIHLKNIGKETLFFKDFRKNGILIQDSASNDGFRTFEGMYFLSPPPENELPDEFQLEPGESKAVSFFLPGSLCWKAPPASLSQIGVERRYDCKPGAGRVLTKPNGKCNFYDPAVYFYDTAGTRFKSSGQQMILNEDWHE